MVADLEKSLGQSLGTDFYLMDELLTEEERNVRDKVSVFCDKEGIPIINDYWLSSPLNSFLKLQLSTSPETISRGMVALV